MGVIKTALILFLFLTVSSNLCLVQCTGEKDGRPAVNRKETATEIGDGQKENAVSPTPAGKEKAAPRIKVTFVELGSVNCIPCKMMQPVMKAIEEEYGDQVKVVFHDVWTEQGQPYAQQYGIRAIPTQVFLDENGKEYYRHSGFFPKEELVKILAMKGVK